MTEAILEMRVLLEKQRENFKSGGYSDSEISNTYSSLTVEKIN